MISGDCARLAATAHRSVLHQSTRFTPLNECAAYVFSIEVVEAPSIALVVATRSLIGSAELEKLGDSLPLSFQKNARSPIFA
jgi:hypothetical protein